MKATLAFYDASTPDEKFYGKTWTQWGLDQNNMSLIYGSNKITGSRGINPTDHIQDDRVIRILRFDQIDDSALLNCNTKLFRLIVDIYEKQVIQEQVLDKTVTVKTFASGS